LSCGLRTFGLRLALVAVDEIGADYNDQPFNCNPSLPQLFSMNMALFADQLAGLRGAG
jgi:hypothetical protein